MNKKTRLLVAVASLAVCSGCALTQTVKKNEEVSRRIRKDMIDFYENMAQAYYLLGFGYYQLHKDSVAGENEAAAEQYKNNAVLYKRYYEDLMESVRIMRREFEITAPESAPPPVMPIGPEAAPTTDIGSSVTTEVAPLEPVMDTGPEIVPAAPEPEKPSLLDRLKSRFKKQPAGESVVAPVEPKRGPSLWERIRPWGKKD